MANKHDPHAKHILSRSTEGASRAQIARELEALGVKTTGQEIYLWLKRRAGRIQLNRSLVDPLMSMAPVAQPTPASLLSKPQSSIQPPPLTAKTTRKDRMAWANKGSMNIVVPTEEELEEKAQKRSLKNMLKKK